MQRCLSRPDSPDGATGAWLEPSRILMMCSSLVFSGGDFWSRRENVWKSDRVRRDYWIRSRTEIKSIRAVELSQIVPLGKLHRKFAASGGGGFLDAKLC